MTMAKQGTATPRLRFPEFRSTEGWKPSHLRDAGRFLRGLTYGASDVHDHGLLVLRSANIQDGNLVLDNDLVFVEKDCPLDLLLQSGDIAICMSNGSKPLVGKSAEFACNYSGQATVGAFCSIFRPSMSFAKLAFQTQHYADFVALAIGGGNINNLKNSDLESFEFSVPGSPAEQQKIADCLTSLDEVIATQGRKVETLKAHKRGLMQQLFPRIGETRPRLRFPEFRNAPEWKISVLQPYIQEFREKSTKQDEYEVLTSARTGLVRQRDYYDNDSITERDNVGFNVIPPKYLTYRSRSDDRKFYFNENDLGITGIISIYYPIFKIRGGSNKFFIELLARYSDQVGKYSVGTSQTVLSLNELRRVKLPVPAQEEQQRIANCLSSLDTQITAESGKLAALKTHKRGLMQQLFPAPETD